MIFSINLFFGCRTWYEDIRHYHPLFPDIQNAKPDYRLMNDFGFV